MKPSKYRNVQTIVDGHKFPSKAEARRYSELKLLQRAGKIRGLRLQPRFPLFIGEHLICTYVGDFQYEEPLYGATDKWKLVCEDVKGVKTSVYRVKKNLLFALEGITIRET